MSRVSYSEAWRRVKRILENCDLIVEVIDAREPVETRSIEIEKLAENLGKRVIIAMNKCDLVPLEVLKAWKKILEKEYPTVFLSAKYRLGTRKLIVYIKKYAPSIPVKVAIVGYPNVGKSTIINYLKGRHVVETSSIPGWTIGEQLVRAKQWLLVIDTPGIVPPREIRNEALLVIKGAIDPGKLEDPIIPTLKLIERILKYNPDAFKERYGIEERDPYRIIELVGKLRGCLLKGGKVNLEEAARKIIRDWIEGKIRYWVPPQ
ncbi:MAG: GTP-binding protein [Thermoprotei archaeon ex4572_64]|nr:MAG: GTP-binding protein [Thermoprotei archaeon ex4572_64]